MAGARTSLVPSRSASGTAPFKSRSLYSVQMNWTRLLKWVRYSARSCTVPGIPRGPRGAAVPPKIVFMHIPKTGGTAISELLSRALCRELGYKQHYVLPIEKNLIPGKPWLRNFSVDELTAISTDAAPLQFIRDHTPWPKDLFRRFKENGWFIFSFVRHPGDLICSWYHYMRFGCGIPVYERLDDCVADLFSGPLEWLIPDYWREMDYIREFSDTSVRGFLEHYVRSRCGRLPVMNLSTNRGFDHYCRTGEISMDTRRRVESHEQFRRYREIAALTGAAER